MMIGSTSGDMGGRTGFMVGGARQISGVLADKDIPTYYYLVDDPWGAEIDAAPPSRYQGMRVGGASGPR